ncbi:DUF4405 domain-containing protein [Paenibacillus aurantius]|uniref:DUF4405 domain-containing protein n=1 Tax=Paenibacillus aurantius TaxID=2918900 RepID=A0AA96LEF0_9BACL|nr:DUF4405 domain-containing protein [Paenibacillus aurantius]WNQ10561.1 DUF4405 domain-containing protein [Paenibacillus aurantius]
MKKLTYVKITIDILMAVTLVLLYNKRVLGGLAFHEIAGLCIGGVFLVHILLNGRWVATVTRKLFDRKLPGRTRFGYLLNLLLLACMSFIIVSGILISEVVFRDLHMGNVGWFKGTHIAVSFLTLIIVGVHVGLHWKWLMNVGRKLFRLEKGRRTAGLLVQAAALLVFLYGGWQIYSTGFLNRVEGVTQLFSSGQGMPGEGRGRPEGMPEGMRREGMPPEGAANGSGAGTAPSQAAASSEAGVAGKDGGTGGGTGAAGFEGRPARRGGEESPFREGGKGGFPGASPWNVLLTYLGILGVFVILTYYAEKLLNRRKPASSAAEV